MDGVPATDPDPKEPSPARQPTLALPEPLAIALIGSIYTGFVAYGPFRDEAEANEATEGWADPVEILPLLDPGEYDE